MKTFLGFVKHELARFLTRRNLLLTFLFVLLSLYMVQNGIQLHKNHLNSISEFKKLEASHVAEYKSYLNYAVQGFQINFIPPVQSIFFYSSGLFSEVNGFINAELKVGTFSPMYGRSLFELKSWFGNDFSGVIFFIGSLIALFWGFGSFRHKEYYRMQACLFGRSKLYFYLLAARLVILYLFFAFLFLLSVLLVLIEGITLTSLSYWNFYYFFIIWSCMLLFLFLLGTVIGSIKSNSTGISVLIATWFTFIFVFPGIVENITMKKAQSIPSTPHLDSMKWNEYMSFERRAIKILGSIRPDLIQSSTYRDIIESFMNNEYKKIQQIDELLAKQMQDKTDFYQLLSIFTPSTFYKSVTDELSGKGYNGVNRFYLYSQDLKHKFCEFYKQKRYYSKDKKVESFIKNDENIYHGKGGLPKTTWPGVIVLAIYTGLMGMFSYSRYKKVLFSMAPEPFTEDKDDIENVPLFSNMVSRHSQRLELKPGNYFVLVHMSNAFKDFLFNACSGYNSKEMQQYFITQNKIYFGEDEISEAAFSTEFMYICHPSEVPEEIRTWDMFDLAAAVLAAPKEEKEKLIHHFGLSELKNVPFGKLPQMKQFDLLLALSGLKRFPLYIFVDIVCRMPFAVHAQMKQWMEEISSQGSVAVLLTEEIMIWNRDENSKYRYADITEIYNGSVKEKN